MAKELTHFIGGKHVKGTSGRFTDAYQPMTGEVISRVPLASKAEVRAAIENAKAAQVGWGATNPQRRARVLMKFLDLVARDMEPLAELLAREHGKTIPDAKGDIQRGVEVIEFSCGVPHLMKGEFTDAAALAAYKAHPAYQASIDRVRPLRGLRISADYEVPA